MTDTRTLYLSGWRFNAANIIHHLRNEIARRGGAIVSTWQSQEPISQVVNESVPGKQTLLLYGVSSFGDSYLSFVFEQAYYYVQLGGNPLMDCMYSKELLDERNCVSRNGFAEELPFDWLTFKNEYQSGVTEDEYAACAANLFSYLVGAKVTTKYAQKERKSLYVLAGPATGPMWR